MADRVDNQLLLESGLELMRQNGKPLTRQPGFGRSMRYAMANGETVRIRTCNDHVLIVLADDVDPDKATLNIEGTDWLLIVMPEVQRTAGKVLAYLIPTPVAVEASRRSHREWLNSNPNTRGGNTTFNLWFDEGGVSAGFAEHWKQYLLPGTAEMKATTANTVSSGSNIKDVVDAARQMIATTAGVPIAAVKITVDFGATA
jgi:hypothetical protein